PGELRPEDRRHPVQAEAVLAPALVPPGLLGALGVPSHRCPPSVRPPPPDNEQAGQRVARSRVSPRDESKGQSVDLERGKSQVTTAGLSQVYGPDTKQEPCSP